VCVNGDRESFKWVVVLVRLQRVFECHSTLDESCDEDFARQFFLVSEVVIDRWRLHTRDFTNVAQSHSCEAFLGEHLRGSVEESASRGRGLSTRFI
jgi:hypothetical protein